MTRADTWRILRGSPRSRYADAAYLTGRPGGDPATFRGIRTRPGWRAVRDCAGVRPSPAYTPRAPAESVLYQIVRDHFETFCADAARAREGDGLPRFIEEEFRGFLRCGLLAGGFARFHCGRFDVDRLVPFSCKGRAVCPSCGGRWMAERAALDHVFPLVPVRQLVLSLPHRLLTRRGVVDAGGDHGGADRWREEVPVLAGIAAASVRGRLALGDRAGAAVRRGGASAERLTLALQGLGPCHARRKGFDLHAGVAIGSEARRELILRRFRFR